MFDFYKNWLTGHGLTDDLYTSSSSLRVQLFILFYYLVRTYSPNRHSEAAVNPKKTVLFSRVIAADTPI